MKKAPHAPLSIVGGGETALRNNPTPPRRRTTAEAPPSRISPAEYRAYAAKRRNKYGAKKTLLDGFSFDSRKEEARYGYLSLLQRAGSITDLEVHKRFPIEVNGTHICDYECDFVYVSRWADGSEHRIVEDVKSEATRTAVYRLKRRLMLAVYGIVITET